MDVITGDVVAQPNGGHGYEAVVKCIQVIPVIFNNGKDGGRDDEDEHYQYGEEYGDVYQSYVECAVSVAQFINQPAEHPGGEDHEAFHYGGEHDECQGNPNGRVHDAEDLATFRKRGHVTIA